MIAHDDLVNALNLLRPGAQWTVRGEFVADYEWLDKIQSKPSFAEIEAVLGSPELIAFIDKREKERKERVAKLSQTNIKDLFSEMIKIMNIDPNDPKLEKAKEIVNSVK